MRLYYSHFDFRRFLILVITRISALFSGTARWYNFERLPTCHIKGKYYPRVRGVFQNCTIVYWCATGLANMCIGPPWLEFLRQVFSSFWMSFSKFWQSLMKWLLALLMILLDSSHGKQPEKYLNFFYSWSKISPNRFHSTFTDNI